MPLYEYQCASCGHAFEKLTRSADRDKDCQCPECGKPANRQFSVFAAGKSNAGSGGSTDAAQFANAPGGCGRCGGAGPCASGDF